MSCHSVLCNVKLFYLFHHVLFVTLGRYMWGGTHAMKDSKPFLVRYRYVAVISNRYCVWLFCLHTRTCMQSREQVLRFKMLNLLESLHEGPR